MECVFGPCGKGYRLETYSQPPIEASDLVVETKRMTEPCGRKASADAAIHRDCNPKPGLGTRRVVVTASTLAEFVPLPGPRDPCFLWSSPLTAGDPSSGGHGPPPCLGEEESQPFPTSASHPADWYWRPVPRHPPGSSSEGSRSRVHARPASSGGTQEHATVGGPGPRRSIRGDPAVHHRLAMGLGGDPGSVDRTHGRRGQRPRGSARHR